MHRQQISCVNSPQHILGKGGKAAVPDCGLEIGNVSGLCRTKYEGALVSEASQVA